MTKEEFSIWLKDHNNKCSTKQLKEIGLTLTEINDIKKWADENGNIVLIGYVDIEDEDHEFTIQECPIVNPIQPPKTDEVVKKFEKWLDGQHYEQSINLRDLNKKFYDKFYERKGRKYRHIK